MPVGRPEDANISLLDRLSVYGRKALRIVATGARFAGGIRRRNPRKVGFFLWLAGAGLAGTVLASFVGALLYVYYGLDLPDHRHLATYEPPGVTQVDADGGERLAEFATEKRVFMPYETIQIGRAHV